MFRFERLADPTRCCTWSRPGCANVNLESIRMDHRAAEIRHRGHQRPQMLVIIRGIILMVAEDNADTLQ